MSTKNTCGARDPRNDRRNNDADPQPEDTETCKCGAIIPKGYGTCDACDEKDAQAADREERANRRAEMAQDMRNSYAR